MSNIPEKMKRAGQDVHFHHEGSAQRTNVSESIGYLHQPGGSHELDAKAMRSILTQILAKTLDMKKKNKNPHHHYKSIFRESDNIEKFDKSMTATAERSELSSGQPPSSPPPLPQQKSIGRFGNHKETSKSSTECVIVFNNQCFNCLHAEQRYIRASRFLSLPFRRLEIPFTRMTVEFSLERLAKFLLISLPVISFLSILSLVK